MKLKAFVIVTAVGFLSGCSVVGPSPTVPFNMTGVLNVGGFIAQPFTVSCASAQDCSLDLKVTSIQPDSITNVALEIVTFGTDSTGATGCILNNVLSSVVTVQGGTGISSPVSDGTFCAAVLDIGQLHQPETITVTGQIPSH